MVYYLSSTSMCSIFFCSTCNTSREFTWCFTQCTRLADCCGDNQINILPDCISSSVCQICKLLKFACSHQSIQYSTYSLYNCVYCIAISIIAGGSDENDDDDVSSGAIAGAVVGIIFVILVIGFQQKSFQLRHTIPGTTKQENKQQNR